MLGLSPRKLLGVFFRLNAEWRRPPRDQANQFGEILQNQQPEAKTLLPIWMTEAASAPAGTLTKVPHVCVAALEALRALLDQTLPPGQGAGRR